MVRSPAYELDVNTYLMSDSVEDYLIHISILVEAAPEDDHVRSGQSVHAPAGRWFS